MTMKNVYKTDDGPVSVGGCVVGATKGWPFVISPTKG